MEFTGVISTPTVNYKGADEIPDELPLSMMEFKSGMLSKKNDLDESGKKSNNRSWQTFFAQLKGEHISFYKSQNKVTQCKLQ
jgi:hypothetical protein